MSAFHRYVLSLRPGVTVGLGIEPFCPVFAVVEADGERFRGAKPAPTLAGTGSISVGKSDSPVLAIGQNVYLHSTVRRRLERLNDTERAELHTRVTEMIDNRINAENGITPYLREKLGDDTVSVKTRAEAQAYVEQEAVFLGITAAVQTPGHLVGQGLVEAHLALSGAYTLKVGNATTVRIGDPVFASVPFFKKPTVPIGYVVAGKSHSEIIITLNKRAIGRTL